MDRLSRARGTICLSFSCVHAGRGSASLPGLAWGAPSYSGLCWMGSRAVLGEKEGRLYSNRDERKLKSMGKSEPSLPSLPLSRSPGTFISCHHPLSPLPPPATTLLPPLDYLTGAEILVGIRWEGMWLCKMQFARFRCPWRPASPLAIWEPCVLLCFEFSEMMDSKRLPVSG